MFEKLRTIYRRLKLGKEFKHQYNCHPSFNLERGSTSCIVQWNNQPIATIPYAGQLQNSFKDSCFIIASGPSLAEVDLKMIDKFDTVSLNCAIKKFKEVSINPTHCIIVDHRIFDTQWACVEASILSGANCFFSYDGLSRICERDPTLFNRGKIYLIESISRKFGMPRPGKIECIEIFKKDSKVYIDETLPELCRSVGFSSNLNRGLFSGKTVATWATQLTVALGYQQMFIIGMDLGGTGKKHFYADNHNKTPDFMRDYEPHIRVCFEQVKRASLAEGFKVYNLSKDSTLPHAIISKITMEEALALASKAPQ
ncbi:MAG: hypothetical protein CVU29_02255 [Betaproteobacteria bacterium HGW-Betaproteobacteria-22]|nr:MAG: hypothetical protein CVU29_02255 [Betaproteobacteria bacterium HGW-Betaproteobacteria-22]